MILPGLKRFLLGSSAQLCATKWSVKIQFYRKIRSPRSVDDLIHYMYNIKLVWIDEETFVLLKKLPRSVPRDSKFRKATTSIEFEQRTVYIYGVSGHSVARATKLILCLKDGRSSIVRLANQDSRGAGPVVPTTFITSRFLCEYMKSSPQRRLFLGRGCELSKDESIALASHPVPLNVGLACKFFDQGRTFVETLAKRSTHFGILAVSSRSFNSLYSSCSSFGLLSEFRSAFSSISLETHNWHYEGLNCLLPLTTPARRVEYRVYQMGFHEIESLTVVPKAVTLVFDYCLPAHFHSKFLQASGDVQELGLIYDITRSPSAAQHTELLQAIRTNQNLYRLELGCLNLLREFWQQLLELIGSHASLRTVVFWVREH